VFFISNTSNYIRLMNQRWNMFDIDTKNKELKITWFSINSQVTNWDIRVFYREWYYAWFENSSAWWNLVWDYSFIWPWDGNPTFISIDEVILNQSSSYSFYIFVTSWTNLNYTNWITEWWIYVQDNNLIIREWVWKWADFNSTFRPRIWNGIIHYNQRWNMFDIDTKNKELKITWFSINSQVTNWDIKYIIENDTMPEICSL